MQIANPIYDVVFKFLMEDTPSAIILLSTIIGEEIEDLDYLPQENTAKVEHSRSLTVYRLDFSAKIRTQQGECKQVLIEIQKAKLPSDIMRFRRYLGEQYGNKNNTYQIDNKSEEGEGQKIPLPIITIYFLGYSLEHIKVPIIKVNRDYYDVVNQRKLDTKEVFIESLTHDSYVIQISQLRAQHQSEIEQLLSIFDQHRHLPSDVHILDITEADYPEKYWPLIRRLQRAISDSDVRKTMDIEDELLEDLQNMERLIERQGQALKEKDQALEEKKQALEEKDHALEAEKQTVEAQKQALDEKNQALEEQQKLIEELKQQLSK